MSLSSMALANMSLQPEPLVEHPPAVGALEPPVRLPHRRLWGRLKRQEEQFGRQRGGGGGLSDLGGGGCNDLGSFDDFDLFI